MERIDIKTLEESITLITNKLGSYLLIFSNNRCRPFSKQIITKDPFKSITKIKVIFIRLTIKGAIKTTANSKVKAKENIEMLPYDLVQLVERPQMAKVDRLLISFSFQI